MEYSKFNDYELLYLVSDNNEEAYNLIYLKYKPLIHNMAKTLSNRYRSAYVEYEDLFQEGMYGLSEAIKRFNNQTENLFYTFAYLCIKREMYRLVVKMLRMKNMILSSASSFNTEISNEEFLLEDTLFSLNDFADINFESSEIQKYILNLKYELKEQYMPVYELKLNGFSNQDITILLDLEYKVVDNYLRSIKNVLRKKILKFIE